MYRMSVFALNVPSPYNAKPLLLPIWEMYDFSPVKGEEWHSEVQPFSCPECQWISHVWAVGEGLGQESVCSDFSVPFSPFLF